MGQAPAPQPSSTTTTLRAMVMLACLIGIPAFAFRVTDFPIREWVIAQLGGTVSEEDARADLEEAPPFVPEGGGDSLEPGAKIPAGMPDFASTAPNVGVEPLESSGQESWRNPPMHQRQPISPAASSERPPEVPRGGLDDTQRGTQPGPGAVLANYDSPRAPGEDPAMAMPPVYRSSEAAGRFGGAGEAAPPHPNVGLPSQAAQQVGGPGTVDQFAYIEKRLQDLGADYYLLEKWGSQGECYRFHCRVAVGNSANFTKHFEATGSQPLGAMTQVLADVESWRRGTPALEPQQTPPIPMNPSPGSQASPPVSPHGPYAR